MKYTYIIVLLSLNLALFAQPSIQWQKCLGGSDAEDVSAIRQTSDGGYVVAGFSASTNGDASGWHGGTDFWVVKMNGLGQIQWQKMLGGTKSEFANDIIQTSDEGYIVVGESYSNDGDVSGNNGDEDIWVVKLTQNGNIAWQINFGGSSKDIAKAVLQTADEGYIIAGYSASMDGDNSSNIGGYDFWILKLNDHGELQWEKSYGGSKREEAHAITPASGGGFVVAGETWSDDGDVSGNNGNTDNWVIKISNDGVLEWQKPLGGQGADVARSIVQTLDGGYALVGESGSYNNGQVSGSHGAGDSWVVKLNMLGEIEWQKPLGGSKPDWGGSIRQTTSGDYVVIGTTISTDGDATGNDGIKDAWGVKLNEQGDVLWHNTLGGTLAEWTNCLELTSDGGYIIAGYTWSNDGEVSGYHGYQDIWVVKFAPLSTPTISLQPAPLEIYPNPAHQLISLQLPASFPTETGDEFPMTIRITNLPGREIMRQVIDSEAPLNIEAIPKGLYLLTAITNSGKVFSGKFMKQE